jgi:hypothetical protein
MLAYPDCAVICLALQQSGVGIAITSEHESSFMCSTSFRTKLEACQSSLVMRWTLPSVLASIPLHGNFGSCALWRDLRLFGYAHLQQYAVRLGTFSDIQSLNTLKKLATEFNVPACFILDLTR